MTSLDTQTTASITASVSLTSQHPDSGPCRAPEKMHLSLTFVLDPATPKGITVNTFDSILTPNNYLWDSFLCVIDTQTGEEICLPPAPSYLEQPLPAFGAERLQALTFPFSAHSPARYQILTLQPGEQTTRTATFESSCLFHRYQKVLVEGKRYGIKLKSGQTASRWIWGGLEDFTEALGWSGIRILETGELAQFIFHGPSEEAVSFPQPNCHIVY